VRVDDWVREEANEQLYRLPGRVSHVHVHANWGGNILGINSQGQARIVAFFLRVPGRSVPTTSANSQTRKIGVRMNRNPAEQVL
jgi:hypothetical protein